MIVYIAICEDLAEWGENPRNTCKNILGIFDTEENAKRVFHSEIVYPASGKFSSMTLKHTCYRGSHYTLKTTMNEIHYTGLY